MPPYEPVKSKSQSRKLFALAREGKVPIADAKGKTAAADFKRLPFRTKSKARSRSRR